METPVEIYYKTHPDATIKDFIDFIKEETRRKNEAERERSEKCTNWYKELAGRYFIFNFNGSSFLAVYVDHCPSNEFNNKYQCYGISIKDSYCISNQNGREVNRYWFKNPYEEITKEEFDDIANKYSQIKDIVESINLK